MAEAGSLWGDPDLYQRRYEKTASALIAVVRTLERARPLGGAETDFLRLFEEAESTDPEVFTRVWLEPVACYWTTLAYQLLGGCLSEKALPPLSRDYCAAIGAENARTALTRHLREFARLALGIAVAAGTDLALREPLEVTLPFAIPATRWSLVGEGTHALHGFIDRRLRVRYRGRDLALALDDSASEGLLEECPVARCEDFALRLQPEAIQLPGLDFVKPLRQLAPGYQRTHAALVGESLSLIRRHQPGVFAHLQSVLRLVALKPQKLGDTTNSSHSDLPGAFVVSVVAEPYTLADSIIHEFLHNQLFFIEDEGALFEDSEYTLAEVGTHYSPWRPDLRPVQGLFHGFYVYLPVGTFWLRVVQSGETGGVVSEYARDQLLRATLQLRIAAKQLECYARLTARGLDLFRALCADLQELGEAVDALGLPADLPAIACSEAGALTPRRSANAPVTVRDEIVDHARRVAQREVAADVESILASSSSIVFTKKA